MHNKISNRHTPHAFGVVLNNRDFRNLWFGQICSQLAVSTMLFVLALRIYQTTGSNAAVSGLFLTFGIPAVLFGIGAGAIVDHFDKRQILVGADALRSVVVLGFLFFTGNLIFFYALALVNALITQFYVPAEAPMIPRFVRNTELVTANSFFSFTYYSSLALGTILAGPILRWFGPQGAFLFISFLFILASMFVYRLPKEHGKQNLDASYRFPPLIHIITRIASDIRNGFSYISTSPVLMDALLLLTGTQVIIALLGTLGPGFADRMLQIDIRDSSLVIIGPVVIGIIMGALWIGNMGGKISESKLIRWGITSAGILLLFIAITVKLRSISGFSWLFHNWLIIPLELVLFFLLGIANSMLDVPANSILQKEAIGPMRSRVYGMLTTAVGGVGILPIVVSGILADVLGVGKVIFLLGFGISAYGLYRIRYNLHT